MNVLDKFLDAIKMNDDYDDDDDFFDEEDEIEEEKPKKRFFSRRLEEEDEEEAEPARSRTRAAAGHTSAASAATRMPNRTRQQASQQEASPKVTPMRRKQPLNMEVCVIKPASMEDTREIADTLLAGCTVILNLEGIDVEVAQRIIDFCCGSSYCLNGGLQKVSGYIFILTPSSVEISGDIQDLLSGAFDIPSIRTDF